MRARVLHVITRLIIGGAQENTVASVLGLDQRGWTVRLASGPARGPEGSLEGQFRDRPELYCRIARLVRPVHPLNDWLAYLALRQLIRTWRPALVHTHSGKAGILGRLAARASGVPIIIHSIHGPSFGAWQGPLANALFRSAEGLAGRVTTHFITVADALRDQYLAAGIGRADQFTRIFSGFELRPFLEARNDADFRRRLGIDPGDLVVGKIARLFKLKGHDDLFAIAPQLVARCPRLKFLLVGDGPWRERFESRARALGLGAHFIFAGLVPPQEVARYIGVMDIVIHLSRREGLPRALPQALAARKPVIAYDADGAREVCLDGVTGFLVPPGNRERLVEGLLALAGDPQLRERLAGEGQRRVRSAFSVEQMIEAQEQLYEALIRGAGAAATAC